MKQVLDSSPTAAVQTTLPDKAFKKFRTSACLTKLVRELAEGKEPTAALQSDQYGLRAIAKVSPIASFDEFMRVHGDEGKAAVGPGSQSHAAASAVQ